MIVYVKLIAQYLVIVGFLIVPCFFLLVESNAVGSNDKAYEYIVNANFTAYTDVGKKDTMIFAEFWENTKDEIMNLQKPELNIVRDASSWNIKAAQAYVYKDTQQQNKIFLKKQVVVKHVGQKGESTYFYTESLNYYRKNQDINTTDFVKIVKANGSELSGKGLVANLITNKFVIQEQVKTVFKD